MPAIIRVQSFSIKCEENSEIGGSATVISCLMVTEYVAAKSGERKRAKKGDGNEMKRTQRIEHFSLFLSLK